MISMKAIVTAAGVVTELFVLFIQLIYGLQRWIRIRTIRVMRAVVCFAFTVLTSGYSGDSG